MALLTDSIYVDVVGVITAIAAVVYAYLVWTFQYWKRRNVPYLEPKIPFGNFENPRTRQYCPADFTRLLYAESKKKSPKYCGIYNTISPNLLVTDLDIIKQVMTKDFNNFTDRGFYHNERDDPLSAHLFTLGGKKWKNLRAKLSPTFTSGKLKNMFNTLVDCGEVMEKYIDKYVDKGVPIDIKNVLGNFSTDIIGSCAFGLECNSFEDENSPFRVYGKKIFDGSTVRNLKLALGMNFPNFARMLRLTITPKDVSEFFLKVVNDTVSFREKNNYKRNDFLQLLIEVKNSNSGQENGKGDGKSLTMNEVTAQCFIFFLAGFETSSTTMTYALFELARHQDLQDKVREEIKTVLAKHDNKITYDSLSELKYMRQVIDETLRKYSPVPFLTRVSESDYKVPNEDIIIEKGVTVFIPISGIHNDEEYYENPSEFNPDRFSDENKAGRHPYAHIPFGEGPRICIGERLGVMQTKVGMTTILRNFKVTLNEEKTKLPLEFLKTSFVPSVIGGIWLNIERV